MTKQQQKSQNLPLDSAYRQMQRIRRVEEEIERLYPTDKIKSPIHLSIGQESIAVGVCMALEQEDVVFSNYRGHAHYLAKNGSMNLMWAELFGKANGGSGGVAGSMHLDDWDAKFMCTSAIVASGIPNAAGFALASKMDGTDEVTVCFHGDGATEEGVFWETLNFAALKQLPILFICENNNYAIYSHTKARTAKQNIAERAGAFGVSAITVQGETVEAVYQATLDALAHIRGGQGPVLLELTTTRWRDHVGPGEDRYLGYRSDESLNQAIENDEIARVRKILPAEETDKIDQEIEDEIAAAIEFAENGLFPDSEELLTHVYA